MATTLLRKNLANFYFSEREKFSSFLTVSRKRQIMIEKYSRKFQNEQFHLIPSEDAGSVLKLELLSA